jgi:hypothetical protein
VIEVGLVLDGDAVIHDLAIGKEFITPHTFFICPTVFFFFITGTDIAMIQRFTISQ